MHQHLEVIKQFLGYHIPPPLKILSVILMTIRDFEFRDFGIRGIKPRTIFKMKQQPFN
ncbi:8060_t:CDS:2 [Funneliformis mosseae]|uniref:8060_t:CDS:1 n=1 Tax=Funneliformis mosseae TaxID=27381 RepID=A0A9N9FCY5_FUNMO|nr:8060_t:CDS:2 [Funneliformis mosseae]